MTFAQKVYDAVKRIPKGRVATYGQIAEIVGCPGGFRAVGNALHVNPFAPVVPCHRVVAADGSLAANFGCGGWQVQYERLMAEGVSFVDGGVPRVDLERCGIVIESHPLEPFLPSGGRILFLGSFPPPKARWSMDFFYPNWINDFWRIQGLIHFGDAKWFESGHCEGTVFGGEKLGGSLRGQKCFDRQRIIEFCESRGLAFFDTAAKVCRLKGNASDEFLEILEPADVAGMLARMPLCGTVVTTGGKSAEELGGILAGMGAERVSVGGAAGRGAQSVGCCAPIPPPPVGSFLDLSIPGLSSRLFSSDISAGPSVSRALRWWRMPSSSRAFPMSLSDKASHYAKLFATD